MQSTSTLPFYSKSTLNGYDEETMSSIFYLKIERYVHQSTAVSDKYAIHVNSE